MMLNAPIDVVGVGSPYGIDQLGWRVIDCLGEQDCDVSLYKVSNPIPELLPICGESNNIIVVDAMAGNAQPGTFYFDHYSRWREPALPSSTHGFGLAQALALAKSLNCLPEQTYVCGMCMGETGAGELDDLQVIQCAEGLLRRLNQAVCIDCDRPVLVTKYGI